MGHLAADGAQRALLRTCAVWRRDRPHVGRHGSAELARRARISDFSFLLFGGYDDNARLVADQWRWPGRSWRRRIGVSC